MNLGKICHGKFIKKCFEKLRVVEVDSCDKLKNLFSFLMSKDFLQLEEISVTSCKMIEKIILYEIEDDPKIFVWKLSKRFNFLNWAL